MTVHLASEILRLIFQQVVIWVWNYGMVIFNIFFPGAISSEIEHFCKCSCFHVLTLQTVLAIRVHVKAYLLHQQCLKGSCLLSPFI